MKCTSCGIELAPNQTCPQCGTVAPAYEAPVPPQYMADATVPRTYKPLSPWAYYGLQLLFSIPLVGFICLIVFSLDDSNLNRRNFARSYWCGLIISLVLIIAVVVLILATGAGASVLSALEDLPL